MEKLTSDQFSLLSTIFAKYWNQDDDCEKIKELVNKIPSLDYYQEYSLSPLASAVSFNDISTVKYLLDSGADPNYTFSSDRFTALKTAARHNHHQILQILLDCGADPNIENDSNLVALDIACDCEALECVNILIPITDKKYFVSAYACTPNDAIRQKIQDFDPDREWNKVHYNPGPFTCERLRWTTPPKIKDQILHQTWELLRAYVENPSTDPNYAWDEVTYVWNMYDNPQNFFKDGKFFLCSTQKSRIKKIFGYYPELVTKYPLVWNYVSTETLACEGCEYCYSNTISDSEE